MIKKMMMYYQLIMLKLREVEMDKNLDDRMRAYEKTTCSPLPINTPLIMRLDGRAFHTLTRGLEKPFDEEFIELMNAIAIDLCDNEIMNSRMAFLQSDEISILIYNKIDSDVWFGNDVQKMVSIASARASSYATDYHNNKFGVFGARKTPIIMFDARVFVVPEKDVCNYFIWRQKDWERNSIQMLTRKYYSDKHMYKKNRVDMQEMIFQKGDNWNDLPIYLRRGRCIIPVNERVKVDNKHFKGKVDRTVWKVDEEIPIFTEDRGYIEKQLKVGDEE